MQLNTHIADTLTRYNELMLSEVMIFIPHGFQTHCEANGFNKFVIIHHKRVLLYTSFPLKNKQKKSILTTGLKPGKSCKVTSF